jgi:hypothetical protein
MGSELGNMLFGSGIRVDFPKSAWYILSFRQHPHFIAIPALSF